MGVAFIEDGAEILVLATEGTLRRYILDETQLLELARARVGRELTEDECDLYLHRTCEP